MVGRGDDITKWGKAILYSGARKRPTSCSRRFNRPSPRRRDSRGIGTCPDDGAAGRCLLRYHRKLDWLPGADPAELLPVFQRSNPERWKIKIKKRFSFVLGSDNPVNDLAAELASQN